MGGGCSRFMLGRECAPFRVCKRREQLPLPRCSRCQARFESRDFRGQFYCAHICGRQVRVAVRHAGHASRLAPSHDVRLRPRLQQLLREVIALYAHSGQLGVSFVDCNLGAISHIGDVARRSQVRILCHVAVQVSLSCVTLTAQVGDFALSS